MSIDNSIQKFYTNRNKKRLGSIGLYDRERAELFSNWLGTGKKVLEIGCRDGNLTKLFAAGNEMIGVDVDKESLALFEKNVGGKIYCLDLNNEWPFKENEFDAVAASEVLEHLYRPHEIIERIFKTIKPGGLFIGSVPNAFSLINRIRLFMARPQKTALSDPTHVHQFSYSELKRVLEKYFKEVKFISLGRLSLLGKISPNFFSFIIVFYAKK